MGRPTTEERLAKIHAAALEAFDAAYLAVREERRQCAEDRRFATIAGAQWEGDFADQFENKPKLELNRVHRQVRRVVTDYRENPISVVFVSKDGAAADETADACAALFRSDEQDSNADEAYDIGVDEAISGGFGAWRVAARAANEYDEDGEDDADEARPQRIRIEPIPDADSSVYFDPNAKRQDKSDARWCFVITSMTPAEYRRKYPEDEMSSWSKENYGVEFDWCTPDVVNVAEYYMLEECPPLAGRQIPIVPVYGERWYIGGVERCQGVVRQAKDPQRLLNTQASKLLELSAYAGVEKPIFDPAEVAGHQVMWSEDNKKNYPYLLRNRIYGPDGQPILSPQEYTKTPNVPQASTALLQIADGGLRDVFGNPDQAEKQVSHVPGRAVELLHQQIDRDSALYLSNIAKAKKRTGQIWLSMSREVYAQPGRKMKGIGPQRETSQIELMKPVIGPDYRQTTTNDLSRAAFDVVATVGPSSVSQGEAAVATASKLLPSVQDPALQRVLILSVLMNSPGEGNTSFRRYARQELVALGFEQPTPEEAQKLAAAAQNQQPTPADQYALAEAEKAKAQAQKALADIQLTAAQTDKTKAETTEILSDIDTSRQTATVDAVSRLHEMQQVSLDQIPQTPASAPRSAP